MYLDEQNCVFGEVVEGLDSLDILNETICDQDTRPYQDVRITHTVVLETKGKTAQEINEIVADKLAKAGTTILEMIGDIPDADMTPSENVLFICKLNPVTTDEDLNIIFSRLGKINSCEVIRDRKTGESLQYAFVEFDEQKSCEDAYFKMDNVLIDDRRIHVDFSQSVAKVKWLGKGRGVINYDTKRNDLGKGRYLKSENFKNEKKRERRYKEEKEERYRKSNYESSRNQSTSRKRSCSRDRSKSRDNRHYDYNRYKGYEEKERSKNNDRDERRNEERSSRYFDVKSRTTERYKKNEDKSRRKRSPSENSLSSSSSERDSDHSEKRHKKHKKNKKDSKEKKKMKKRKR